MSATLAVPPAVVVDEAVVVVAASMPMTTTMTTTRMAVAGAVAEEVVAVAAATEAAADAVAEAATVGVAAGASADRISTSTPRRAPPHSLLRCHPLRLPRSRCTLHPHLRSHLRRYSLCPRSRTAQATRRRVLSAAGGEAEIEAAAGAAAIEAIIKATEAVIDARTLNTTHRTLSHSRC